MGADVGNPGSFPEPRDRVRNRFLPRSGTHRFLVGAASIVLFLLGMSRQPALAAPPVAKSSRLGSGLRIVCVYFQHSTNVTIFTFLPMGLAADGPKQTQW